MGRQRRISLSIKPIIKRADLSSICSIRSGSPKNEEKEVPMISQSPKMPTREEHGTAVEETKQRSAGDEVDSLVQTGWHEAICARRQPVRSSRFDRSRNTVRSAMCLCDMPDHDAAKMKFQDLKKGVR
jgi:hypothetical protein